MESTVFSVILFNCQNQLLYCLYYLKINNTVILYYLTVILFKNKTFWSIFFVVQDFKRVKLIKANGLNKVANEQNFS